jgi:hypothetical protein
MLAILPSVGPTEFLVLAGILTSFGLAAWGIVDAASRDEKQWRAAGLDRGLWITVMAAGAFLCAPVGLVFSAYYLASVRKRLRAVPE